MLGVKGIPEANFKKPLQYGRRLSFSTNELQIYCTGNRIEEPDPDPRTRFHKYTIHNTGLE